VIDDDLHYGGSVGSDGLLDSGADLGWAGLAGLLVHAAINAVIAPMVIALVHRVAIWSGDEAAGRPLHVDPLRGRV